MLTGAEISLISALWQVSMRFVIFSRQVALKERKSLRVQTFGCYTTSEIYFEIPNSLMKRRHSEALLAGTAVAICVGGSGKSSRSTPV